MVDNSDIIEIIKLYRKFSKYNSYTDREIAQSIIPSLSLSQYKKHYDKDKLIGFTNWCFLSKDIKTNFLNTGVIKDLDWNTGNNLVFIEFISSNKVKDIFKWCINKAKTFNNIEKEFSWIRIDNNKIKRINKKQIR
tara:strand:- start:1598 stop:2005 length:408 start_codon:yes stop_codon:yes gene_type:complete